MTVKAQYLGLFAQSYDSVTDDSVASSITMRNSTVEITTAEESAVFCGAGGILIEDTSLMIKTDKEFYGYGLYSEGDVVIKGSKTDLSIEGATGISADKKIIIEGGTVDVSTVDTALLGWDGVTITEGIVNAESEAESAILARDGTYSISGDATRKL